MRPDHVPAHELLYSTAAAEAARRQVRRRQQEEEAMRECSFKPVLVAPPAKEGRALKLAGSAPVSRLAPRPPSAAVIRTHSRQGPPVHQLRPKGPPRQRRDPQRWDSPPDRASAAAAARAPEPASEPAQLPARARSSRPPSAAAPAVEAMAPQAAAGEDTWALQLDVRPFNPVSEARVAPEGESLEDGIDAIERQIKEAMSRLNFSGEHLVTSLRDSREGGMALAPAADHRAPAPLDAAARMVASLDYHALLGTPTDTHPSPAAFSGISSLREFNPMDDGAPADAGESAGAAPWGDGVALVSGRGSALGGAKVAGGGLTLQELEALQLLQASADSSRRR